MMIYTAITDWLKMSMLATQVMRNPYHRHCQTKSLLGWIREIQAATSQGCPKSNRCDVKLALAKLVNFLNGKHEMLHEVFV